MTTRPPVPVSTYRVQLGPGNTFADVATQVPYLASLGVTHLYLSPVLRAAPGSTHGYDVVDHTRISDVLGGPAGLRDLARTARAAGLALVLDVVPNHMAAPTPGWLNRQLWSVLALGPESPYAHWFDVDWAAEVNTVLMPVLGSRLGDVLAAGELSFDEVRIPVAADGSEVPGGVATQVLRYYDHVFPVRAGTENLSLAQAVDRQHYRLAYWRVGDEELNYRRFFDVGSLVAVRVEDPDVFEATHALTLALVADGTVDGLRIDHPDGLADPGGYLERLAERTGGAWVVAEKILAADEDLPASWPVAGTTGYDMLWRIQQLFIDPGGRSGLAQVLTDLTGEAPGTLPAVINDAKREVVTESLYAEVHRLTDLAVSICRDDPLLQDHTWRGLHQCLAELLIAFDRYRAYAVPGEEPRRESVEAVAQAVAIARDHLDAERHPTLDVLAELMLGREAGSAGRRRDVRRDEFMVRFQQVCGAVMAKGVEDTAFYRWTELVGLCEVGGAPDRFGIDVHEWHAFAARFTKATPHGLTAGSTHDTKRGEDTRAALALLSHHSAAWTRLVGELRAVSRAYRPTLVDGHAENVLWQTIAGTWTDGPIDGARLHAYLTKALREAKIRTSWTTPDERYERAVARFMASVIGDPDVLELFGRWARDHASDLRAVVLGTKLVQLTAPGVADVYQGSESWWPTLVDPDNRQVPDYAEFAGRLDRVLRTAGAQGLADEAAGTAPAPGDNAQFRTPGQVSGRERGLSDEKLFVTTAALRLRRSLPEAFVGPDAGYLPVASSTPCVVAFARTIAGVPQVVTVATRLPRVVHRFGGWDTHTVVLPPGPAGPPPPAGADSVGAGAPTGGDAPNGSRTVWRDLLSGQVFEAGSVRLGQVLTDRPVALFVAEAAFPADEAASYEGAAVTREGDATAHDVGSPLPHAENESRGTQQQGAR